MSIFSLIQEIFKPAAELVDNLHTSDEERLELKAKMDQISLEATTKLTEFMGKMLEEQAKVISGEVASQDKWVRRWRPLLMYVIIIILVGKFIIYPLFAWAGFPDIELPEKLYTLLEIGVGGYIIGRSGEKMVDRWRGGNPQ